MTPTHPVDVADILREAAILVGKAEAMGVKLRITHAPKTPLAMGNTYPVIEAWPARHGVPDPRPMTSGRFAPPRMSDREWAARDPSLREGSTVRVPGIGEI